MKNKTALILGSGPIGCCYALLLARAGWNITLIEQRALSDCCKASGRSVNLVLGTKGWNMLKQLGYETQIAGMIVSMVGRRIHDRFTNGETKDQPYGRNGQSLDSINRTDLNAFLIERTMEEPGVSTKFGVGIDTQNKNTAGKLLLTDGTTINTSDYDLIIGADGINSGLRANLERQGHVTGTRTSLNYGYVEINFPAGLDGDYCLPKEYLHIWPLGQTMLIALANPDSTFTGGLFAPLTESKSSFEDIAVIGTENFYQRNFPYIKTYVPNIVHQHQYGKVSGLGEVRYNQWHHDNMVIVGDAAHAVTPFFGQGMNFGMYLCGKLCELLDQHPVSEALALYEGFRTEANLLADWSLANFTEMANTDDEDLNLRKKIEARLEEEEPSFASFHSMVCFRNTPYLVIRDTILKQDVGFEKVLQLQGVREHWNNGMWPKVKELMTLA